MLTMMRKRMSNQKGFTLVELLVVVVIIGVLVAIAVPLYNAQAAKAELNACLANQRIIDGAIVQYQMDNNNAFPGALNDLVGEYIQDTPTCPDSGTYTLPTATSTGKHTTCNKHTRP